MKKLLLRLLGVDLDRPLETAIDLIKHLSKETVRREVEKLMRRRLSDKRREEVSASLEYIALHVKTRELELAADEITNLLWELR